jgi:hypothetical protein
MFEDELPELAARFDAIVQAQIGLPASTRRPSSW